MKFEYLGNHFSDINECILGTHNCHANAACSNTDGSFTCACNSGYTGNGVTCTGMLNFDWCIVIELEKFHLKRLLCYQKISWSVCEAWHAFLCLR